MRTRSVYVGIQKKRSAHHWTRQRFLHLMLTTSKLITELKILSVVQIPISRFLNYAVMEKRAFGFGFPFGE
jgi:hypothetical protein